MRYRVLITETNIHEETHPEAVRFEVEAETEAEATAKGRERFTELTGSEPAPRAMFDVEALH